MHMEQSQGQHQQSAPSLLTSFAALPASHVLAIAIVVAALVIGGVIWKVHNDNRCKPVWVEGKQGPVPEGLAEEPWPAPWALHLPQSTALCWPSWPAH
jgi:hypothetical protein